jgi:hypothetical protein
LGRVDGGVAAADLKGEAVKSLLEAMPSGFGTLTAVKHAAILSKTPAFWARPAVPLGSNSPQWPE